MMVVHVWDASPDIPVLQDTAPDEEDGRGLMLVEALSKDRGVDRTADGGKFVWAMICPET
jgi:hypothetical protein